MEKAQPPDIFSFYDQLIVGGIKPTIDEFYDVGQVIQINTKDGPKNEMTYLIGSSYYPLDEYLIYISKSASRNVLIRIESILTELPQPTNEKTLLLKYFSDLNYYISKVEKLPLNAKYPFFAEDLKSVKEDSSVKFNYLKENNSKTENINNQMTIPTNIVLQKNDSKEMNSSANYKLKWLGDITVLLTLFYDLSYGQDGNPRFLETPDIRIVKDFLINNFKDWQGNDLSKSTIDTIFSPSKKLKRALKGRIELGNISIKKS